MAPSCSYSQRLYRLSALLLCALTLSRCTPALVVTGGTLGMTATEDRGITGALADTTLRSQIQAALLRQNSTLFQRIYVGVRHGTVLLIGTLPRDTLKQQALDTTRHVQGVHQVIDEIDIGAPESIGDYSRDAWITSKLRTALVCDPSIASRNYSLYTVGKKVYIFGSAQNAAEKQRVSEHASLISGVVDVINHAIVQSSAPAAIVHETPHHTHD